MDLIIFLNLLKECTDDGESDYSVDSGESRNYGKSDDFCKCNFSGGSSYSDEFGGFGESVYSGKSGYWFFFGGSCESDFGESGNFGEYHYSRKSIWCF